jgi:hypothetical protein
MNTRVSVLKGQKLTRNFGDVVKRKRIFLTLGTQRFKIQKSTINMDIIDAHFQRRCRSGVGMLLYLTKYSRPEICNTVQELSKYMDSAKWGTYNEI